MAGRFGMAQPATAVAPAAVRRGSDVVTLGTTGIKSTILGIGTGTRGGREQRDLGEQGFVRLAREAFEGIIESHPLLVYKVMRAVARSAHRIVHRMNTEFIELNNYIFKQHGRY